MRFAFKDLLNQYKVVVPQIQRDYAQGRESEIELRKSFVTKIRQSLQEHEPVLNLDFIYGYTEKSGKDEEVFIPLDGQQRLTTLWLLHWYLSPRENSVLNTEVRHYLSKFTYETRVSSKRFCINLVNQQLEIDYQDLLSAQIMDASWFMASWSNDPTVISMLNMLDTLQDAISDRASAWENLVNQQKVTFDFIDIKSDEFKLTDELYIKMNSRGKPLTTFENFKAQFSELLASSKTDYTNLKRHYENTAVSYQQYFAFKIDSIWIDLFWSYRKQTNNEIDKSIYKFFSYVAEFLFFKNNSSTTSTDVKIDFDFLNKVFSYKQNVDFLFDSLDFLSSFKDGNTSFGKLEEFFENIFNCVSTFDEYSKDYFCRAITGSGFDIKDSTILYAILCFCNNTNIREADDELRDFVRVVRNLLLGVRQPNRSKRIEYMSNLRLTDVSDYCRFIDSFVNQITIQKNKSVYQILSENEFSGFNKENIANEKIKSSLIISNPSLRQVFNLLEDHQQIQGNISNFKLDSKDIQLKITAFLEIWTPNIEDSLIIRAFLTLGDYSVRTHDGIFFFGCKGKWNRILTTYLSKEKEQISDSLDEFLSAYLQAKGNNPVEKMQYMIELYKTESMDWLYYFVKYKAITSNSYRNLNVYSWYDAKGFEINHLGNSGIQPYHSYHLNPYLIVLHQELNNSRVNLHWGRFSDVSCIWIDDKIIIRCKRDGWEIQPVDNFIINGDLITQYTLRQDGKVYYLIEVLDKDKIEIAVEFIKDLLKQLNCND
ncbi:MAG: hypothetical protein CVV49_06220 [Spirochaetae bacterium HGW-Spirochaetae-5]|nr:MAG: hypothetical protein CVV49_06220 [Spirochaetae bacterium HGW-Spirochaetae-5]